MPETTGAFRAYMEEMAKNNWQTAGKNKRDGKLATALEEMAGEDGEISESFDEPKDELV